MGLEYLRPFVTTERQLEILESVIKHGSNNKAAPTLGIARQRVDQAIQLIKLKAAQNGVSPEHDLTHPIAPGQLLKGASTMYDADGVPKLQWVKTSVDASIQANLIEESVKVFAETIKKEKPLKFTKKNLEKELLSLYVITDYHLGVLCWGEECGEDWDTKKSEDLLVKWFQYAIKVSPDSETAIFGQLGDFLHIDGLLPVTPASKHVLDADTRFQKIVRVAIRSIRRVVKLLLEKHKYVHIIMADANHDESSSAWLRELFYAFYDDEPRITVDRSPDTYYCYEHGKTSLFFHHGHKKNPNNIDDVFTSKFRDVFGRTKYSYGHMGHMHHQFLKETNLMIVEQHRTLSAPDAYASRGGYMSGRSACVITYHKDHGEVSRNVINNNIVDQ